MNTVCLVCGFLPLLLLPLLGLLPVQAKDVDVISPIEINLSQPLAHNLPAGSFTCGPKGFKFLCRVRQPADAPGFFIRFGFTLPTAGPYELVFAGSGPGAFRYSRYSWAVDDGQPHPARWTRRVWPADRAPAINGNRQPSLPLAAGAHTLELRFAPEDGKPAMNRVREAFEMHNVELTAAWAVAGQGLAPARRVRGKWSPPDGLALTDGDRIVLLGDSITDEAFYARHLVRLLQAARPTASIEVYNAGITLNRIWEALERVERDVLALKPSWCIVALGTNDCVHMSPAEYAEHYEAIIRRLGNAGIRPVCVSAPGMASDPFPDGSYFHTPDRAAGFDRTCSYQAAFAADIARRVGCPFADVYAAFTRSGVSRKSLMANQWHPNDDGGRIFALALLRTVGLTEADVRLSGDAADLVYFRALAGMTPSTYPAFPTPKAPAAETARVAATCAVLAVSSFTRNRVELFDRASGQAVASIPVGHHPMAPAYDAATQRLYVPCEGSGLLEVIELPACRKLAPIPLGDVYPNAVALSADGQTAWTANFFGSSLMEIDLPTRQVRRTLPLNSLVEGITRVGDTLLLGTRAGVRVWQPGAADAAPAVNVSPYAATFCSPDGQRLCAIDTASWQWVDLTLGQPLKSALRGAAPVNARAVVGDPHTGDLFAGDCAAGTVVRLPNGQGPAVPFAAVECPMGLAVCPLK
jgi:lysophospholipase L1-like esterase